MVIYHRSWTYLALILGGSLTHEGSVIDKAVLGCVFAGLQGSKKCLLCSEDLHRWGWMLCQIQKRTWTSKHDIEVNKMLYLAASTSISRDKLRWGSDFKTSLFSGEWHDVIIINAWLLFMWCTSWRLTCMWNETGADQLAHHDSQVGGNRHHSVLQVVVQLSAVVCDLDHLWKS